MSKFQNFGRPPRAARPSGPVFSGRGPKLKILLPMFCLPPCPNSEKVRHSPPALNPPEEIDLAETHFFGVRPQGPSHLPKNYLQRVKWALKNFTRICPTGQKLWHFFEVTHRRTDRRTDKNKSPQYHNTIIFFAYMWGGNSTNPAKFLPLHFVKDNFCSKHYLPFAFWFPV